LCVWCGVCAIRGHAQFYKLCHIWVWKAKKLPCTWQQLIESVCKAFLVPKCLGKNGMSNRTNLVLRGDRFGKMLCLDTNTQAGVYQLKDSVKPAAYKSAYLFLLIVMHDLHARFNKTYTQRHFLKSNMIMLHWITPHDSHANIVHPFPESLLLRGFCPYMWLCAYICVCVYVCVCVFGNLTAADFTGKNVCLD